MSEDTLRRQLAEREYFWRKKRAFAYLNLHTGLPDEEAEKSDSNLIAQILCGVIADAPVANTGLAEFLDTTDVIRPRRRLSQEANMIGPFYGEDGAAPTITPRARQLRNAESALISVILPIYNVEDYIEDCLVSLAKQDDNNFELVVVDDGGRDRSMDIVAQHAEKFKNLKIHQQSNGGLGAARNAGVDIAAGEFIVFVDSDDTVTPGFIKKLRAKQIEGNYDIVSGRLDRISETGEQLTRTREPVYQKVKPPISDYERTLGVLSPSVSCARLIRKRLLVERGLRFPDRLPHEDLFFTYKLMRNARHASIDTYIYRWRQRASSLSKSFTRAHVDAWLAMRDDTERFLNTVDATQREYAFAARRNLIILENFDRKAASAPEDVRKYFEQTIIKRKNLIGSDIGLIEQSEISHIYYPKKLAVKFGIKIRETDRQTNGGRSTSTRPFYADIADKLRAASPRLFSYMQLLRRLVAALWRRKAWTAPLGALFAGVLAFSLLPAIEPYRGLIWGSCAFAIAILATAYLALRTRQLISVISTQLSLLTANTEKDRRQTRAQLDGERAARIRDSRRDAETTRKLVEKTTRELAEKASREIGDAESLLRAGIANATIIASVNADELRQRIHHGELALTNLSKTQREESAQLAASANQLQSEFLEEKRSTRDRLKQTHDDVAALAKRNLSRQVDLLQRQIDMLKKTSVAIDTIAALRALQPLMLPESAVRTGHAAKEHGHSLLMDVLAAEAVARPGTLSGRLLIEIGATREHHLNQKSTEKLAIFTALTGMKLVTVDMDPVNIEGVSNVLPFLNPEAIAIAQKGEDFLAAHEGELDYVYLDAFDFDHAHHSDARRKRYQEVLGTDINDQECWKMHYACAVSIVEKMRTGGIVVFDDTWAEDAGGYGGKGKTAMPFLLENGFDIIASTKNTIALKRTT
ncbi:MAG: glycosyltransferase [Parvularculaceae bacterium]